MPPMTDKPLKIDEVKEDDSKVEENVQLTGNNRIKRFYCC